MALTKELSDLYAIASRPFIEAPGPITEGVLGLRSWRYLIELNTACNLRCALCTVGNRETGYEYYHGNGLMDMGLLERILDKMKSENPGAIVCPYGNGEPFLHPQLPECIRAIKSRGFRCELATNFNRINRLDEVLCAAPDIMIISVSGFTQEVYGKSHRGGDIEKVKNHLHVLKEVKDKLGSSAHIAVSYHMYNDNLHELDLMRELVGKLNFQLLISWARTITLENTIQSLRFLEKESGGYVPDYPIGKDGLDLNKLMPPSNPEFVKSMERLRFPPRKAWALYQRFPESPVCPVADIFTYIRHDGKVQLCAWCDDRRFTLGNYLDMTQDQISEARRGFPLCRECIRYRLNLYYHVVDCGKWDAGGTP